MRVVFVDVETAASAMLLNRIRLLPGEESKFVPVIVTAAPGAPIVGENPVIVGEELAAETLKLLALVAVPAGEVTVMGPVVALVGTVATICVEVEDVITALVLLNETVLSEGVALKPVPVIATEVPSGP
jgi:hypothetical protein